MKIGNKFVSYNFGDGMPIHKYASIHQISDLLPVKYQVVKKISRIEVIDRNI